MTNDLSDVDVLGLYRDETLAQPRYYASVRSHLDQAIYAVQIDEAAYHGQLSRNPLIIDRLDVAA